jgi:hypothetical protein
MLVISFSLSHGDGSIIRRTAGARIRNSAELTAYLTVYAVVRIHTGG